MITLSRQIWRICVIMGILGALFFSMRSCAFAVETEKADRFCDAVYWAEGGAETKRPYGVLSVPCKGAVACRQICINSYHNNVKRYNKQHQYTDFVEFFSARWCPMNATNDPEGLNKNWGKNVRYLLAHPKGVK